MRIICLGWGSLIWKPEKLPLKSQWQLDGPELPVEFARQSKDGRITLVICDQAQPLPVLWAELDCSSLEQAAEALRSREGTVTRHIGTWSNGITQTKDAGSDAVATWAKSRSIDGVVWTGLGPKFADRDVMPTGDEVLSYLKGTRGDVRRSAEEYIRKAPSQIKTKYRSVIERKLGWTAID